MELGLATQEAVERSSVRDKRAATSTGSVVKLRVTTILAAADGTVIGEDSQAAGSGGIEERDNTTVAICVRIGNEVLKNA